MDTSNAEELSQQFESIWILYSQ